MGRFDWETSDLDEPDWLSHDRGSSDVRCDGERRREAIDESNTTPSGDRSMSSKPGVTEGSFDSGRVTLLL